MTLTKFFTRLVLILSLAIGTLVVLPAQGMAHFVRSSWSYKGSCEWKNVKDPVSVIYFGTGATLSRSRSDLVAHTGWMHNDRDTFGPFRFTHNFNNGHGGCQLQEAERASEGFDYSPPTIRGKARFHVRMFRSTHQDEYGRWHTFVTPHHEDWVNAFSGCNLPFGSHSVDKGHLDLNRTNDSGFGMYSGFDWGRDELVARIRWNPSHHRRHTIKWANWGHTASIKQCDGDYAGSDGSVRFVQLGNIPGPVF